MKRTALLVGVALLLGALALPAAARAPSRFRLASFTLAGLTPSARFQDGRVARAAPLARLQQASWGGAITATDGETVTVYLSDAYPVDPAVQLQTADFLTQLFHGTELQLVNIYLAPLAEVQSVCGAGTAGCYSRNRIVATGDNLPDGTSAVNVLAHEYGHHVAANRNNAPWDAIDWGPKRWASAAGICTRKTNGTAFPGDEGAAYQLNPGEAWAETYRLLNFQKQAWPSWILTSWKIVDQSFYPNAAELEAAKEDVLQPWARATGFTWKGTLRNVAPKGKPVRIQRVRKVVATPLDGDVALAVPQAPAGMTLTASTTAGKVLAGTDLRILPVPICGRRQIVLTVKSRKPGPFRVSVSVP